MDPKIYPNFIFTLISSLILCLDFKSQLCVMFLVHSLFNYQLLLLLLLFLLFIFHFLSPLSSFFSSTYLSHPLSLSPPIPSPYPHVTTCPSHIFSIIFLFYFISFLPTHFPLISSNFWFLHFLPFSFSVFSSHFPRTIGRPRFSFSLHSSSDSLFSLLLDRTLPIPTVGPTPLPRG